MIMESCALFGGCLHTVCEHWNNSLRTGYTNKSYPSSRFHESAGLLIVQKLRADIRFQEKGGKAAVQGGQGLGNGVVLIKFGKY